MIQFSYDRIRNLVEIKLIGCSVFAQVVNVMKKNYIKFDRDRKLYIATPFQAQHIKEMLGDFDEVKCHPLIDKLIDENLFPETTTAIKKYRTKISNPSLFYREYPPKKGLVGFENYQEDELIKILSNSACLSFLDMGLGKSWIIAKSIEYKLMVGQVDRALIFCRSEGVSSILHDLIKFTEGSGILSNGDIAICSTEEREIHKLFDAKVIIVTYTTFKLAGMFYYKHLKKGKGVKPRKDTIPFKDFGSKRALYLDEAQSIGNWDSQQTNMVQLHNSFFEQIYAFSGTYAVNAFFAYYSILKLIYKSAFPFSFHDFKEYIYDPQYNKMEQRYRAENIKRITEHFIQPIRTVLKSEECADLPPLVIEKIYVEHNKKMKELYEYVVTQEVQKIAKTDEGLQFKKVQSKFPYLLSMLSDPSILMKRVVNESVEDALLRIEEENDKINLVNREIREYNSNLKQNNIDKDLSNLELELKEELFHQQLEEKMIYDPHLFKLLSKFKFSDNPKVDTLKNLLDTLFSQAKLAGVKNKKIIVWSGHPSSLDKLAEIFSKYNPICLHGDLGMSGNKRKKFVDSEVERFKTTEDCHIAFLSSRGFKTTLTLNESDTSIYYDLGVDIDDKLQSMKRNHRIGQDKPVTCYFILINKSLDIYIDQDMLDLKARRNKFIEQDEVLDLDECRDLFTRDANAVKNKEMREV